MPYSIKNISPGPRGLNAVVGFVSLEPNESRDDIDMTSEEHASAVATGWFEIDGVSAAPVTGVTDEPVIDDLDMPVPDLHALAAREGVMLPDTGTGKNGAILKSDIQEAIRAARASSDPTDSMTDDQLRDTVAAITGEPAPADADRAALLKLARGQ